MVDFSGAPTTVGSIVGYLKLNKDDWDAKLKEAKAQADELGKDSPDVHLRTNADEVLAQLEAVRVAAGEVDGKSAQLDITTNETTTKRTLSSSDVTSTGGGSSAAAKIDSVTAAQQKLADAELKSATAMDRVKVAQDALTAAESRYQAAADAATAAEDASWRAQQSGVSSAKAKEDALARLQQATVRADQAYAQLSARESALAKAQRDAAQVIDRETSAYGDLQNAMQRIEAVMSAEKTARVAQAQKDLAYYESAAADAAKKAQAAQDAYAAAQDRSAQASKASKDALSAFRDAQNSLTSETSDVTAAFKNLNAAQKDASKASKDLKQAQDVLKVAYQDGARAVDVSSVAYDRLRQVMGSADTAVGKVNTVFQKTAQNANGAVGYTGLLVGAIAALIPLAGPLSAMALGGAAAFTVLGAAGVAAILGIKSEMAAGTQIGQQYSDGMHTLQSDMDQLRATAAGGVLTTFQHAVEQVNGQMPFLNTETARFSAIAGYIGGNVLTAVINGFKSMLPLIIEAAQGTESLSRGLAAFAGSQEFKQFIAYAVNELPQVGQMLMSLVNAAMRLIEGLAPLGNVVVPLITALGNAISAIPVPVLTATAGAVAAVGSAFLTWKLLGPLIMKVSWASDLLKASQAGLVTVTREAAAAEGEAATETVALGSAMDFATGPIGIMLGIASAIGLTMLSNAQSTRDATQAQQDYTAAIEQDNGVVGQATTSRVAHTLAQDGAYASANKLGISTKTLTQATLGNASAQSQLKAQIDATQKKIDSLNASAQKNTTATAGMGRATQSVGPLVNATTAKAEALQKQLDKMTAAYKVNATGVINSVKGYNQYADALNESTINTKAQLQAQTALAGSYGMSLPDYMTAVAAAKQVASQSATTTQALQLEGDAATLLGNALTQMNTGALTLAQAQTGVAAASNSVVTAMKQNGAAIDGTSAAAVANQQAFQQAATAIDAVGTATANATGSTQQGVQAAQAAKTALENQLKAQGLLTPAVQAYIDKIVVLNTMPVPKTVPEMDTDKAEAALKQLQQDIQKTPNTHTTDMDTQVSAAQQAIAALKQDLNNVPADKKTTIETEIASAEASLSHLMTVVNGIPRVISIVAGVTTLMNTSGAIGGHLIGTGHAGGGAITGPGSGTSDTAGLYPLSNGEHVLTASDVNLMGGQNAVYAMRKMLHASGGGYLRVGNPSAAAAPQSSAEPMLVQVQLVDRTTGGLSELVDARVRVVNASDGRMRAIQTMGGNVR